MERETFPRELRGFNRNFKSQKYKIAALVQKYEKKQVYSRRKKRKMFSTTTVYSKREMLGINTQEQDIFY